MPPDDDSVPPTLGWEDSRSALVCSGDWTLAGLSLRIPQLPPGVVRDVYLDMTAVKHLDTAGAVTLSRQLRELETRGCTIHHDGVPARHQVFLELIAKHHQQPPPAAPARPNPVHHIGVWGMNAAVRLQLFFAFVGAVVDDSVPRLLRPHRIRWRQVLGEIEHAGVRALPILGLLIFLTGVVMAYQGGTPLQQFGANIFLVDLLTLTMLREMAPLMTAIIVAGRTGSAYTAQIGTMHITDEVDALRVIGITPYEMLVLPKLLALLIVMPLLTMYADLLGMLGGVTVAAAFFDVGVADFIQRIPEAVAASTFWVGIIKAPVFAVLIVMVSCYHGFAVQRSTESVGRATTQSVVQGIFLVIVADAIFSVVFNMLDL